MANFFDNVLKPYEGNKINVEEYIGEELYLKNVDKIKPRIIQSLASQSFGQTYMKFTGNIYVFSENELKELLRNR